MVSRFRIWPQNRAKFKITVSTSIIVRHLSSSETVDKGPPLCAIPFQKKIKKWGKTVKIWGVRSIQVPHFAKFHNVKIRVSTSI